MKKMEVSEQLKRAVTVIKADRLGVSAGIEKVISSEVRAVLDEFFALNGDVKTVIEVDSRGFTLNIKATATSVKHLKIVE